jgi:hypothetical protein
VIAAGIITAPRPRPTLRESLASYRAAGFVNEPIVCDDTSTRPLGNFRNWVRCMRELIDTTDASHLMVCEDDITWAKEAHRIMVDELLFEGWGGDVGCVSLYTPNKVLNHLRAKGINPYSKLYHGVEMGKSTWGAQALLFRRAGAIALLNNAKFISFLAQPRWTKNVDMLIALALESAGFKIYYRVPCLVNHDLGDNNSSLGYGDRPALRTTCFAESV